MNQVNLQDYKKIKYFRGLFPESLHIKIIPCDEGSFTVEIAEFPGAITQARNLVDLIEMVSDCVATLLEVPRQYLPYMPRYLPSTQLAQRLNAFPMPKTVKKGRVFATGLLS